MRLTVRNFGGYFTCKSPIAGSVRAVCSDLSFSFGPGVHLLPGEIDSGGWMLSHALCSRTGNVLDAETRFLLDGREVPLARLRSKAQDMGACPRTARRVRQLIERAARQAGTPVRAEELAMLFAIREEDLARPLWQTGAGFLQCNAAIGVAGGKDIFCFPWFSCRQTARYAPHLRRVCAVLDEMGKIALLPMSEQGAQRGESDRQEKDGDGRQRVAPGRYWRAGNTLWAQAEGENPRTKLPLPLPHALTWEVYAGLARRFALYEIFSMPRRGADHLCRGVYAAPLPALYAPPQSMEAFWEAAYAPYRKYGVSAQFFREIYVPGGRDRLCYAAVPEYAPWKKRMRRARGLPQRIQVWEETPVRVIISDQQTLEVSTRREEVLEEMVEILRRHGLRQSAAPGGEGPGR